MEQIIAALKSPELNRRQEELSIPAVMALRAVDAGRLISPMFPTCLQGRRDRHSVVMEAIIHR